MGRMTAAPVRPKTDFWFRRLALPGNGACGTISAAAPDDVFKILPPRPRVTLESHAAGLLKRPTIPGAAEIANAFEWACGLWVCGLWGKTIRQIRQIRQIGRI